MTNQEELLKVLVQGNILDRVEVEKIKEELKGNRKSLEQILVERKKIDEEALVEIEAKLNRLDYKSLSNEKIEEDALSVISNEVAENYKIICFEKNRNQVSIGIVDPDNFKAIEAVEFLAKEEGYEVHFYQISRKSFKKGLQNYKNIDQELSTALETKAKEEEIIQDKQEENLEEVTKSAPIAKIVSVIIRHAVEGEASDIHIEPIKNESRIRYRIDGVLHTSLVLPINVHSAVVARIKVLALLKLDETRKPQDGRFKMKFGDRVLDFRVSTLPLVNREKVVMRVLDTERGAPKLDDLGFIGKQLETIKKNLEKTEGLTLVTGPTGSGKSTTIFSMLDILNKEGVNISTLEDPVEYRIKGVNQSQIKPEIGYTFASGLRSFLRQDPDVIMVGEIRDEETAELSIHAGLTGHIVLSTLHTIDSVGAIARLIDMNIESFLIGSTLNTIVAQRLVRKICPDCKTKIKIPSKYLEEINSEVYNIGEDYLKTVIPDFNRNSLFFYKGKGCNKCGNSGYRSRVSIAEVLDVNDQIKDYIKNGEKNLAVDKIMKTQFFITVKQDGIIKALRGDTTIEEVFRVMTK